MKKFEVAMTIQTSLFHTESVTEHHSVIKDKNIVKAVKSYLHESGTTPVMIRLFLSEPSERPELEKGLSSLGCPISFIGQRPLDGIPTAWVWSISGRLDPDIRIDCGMTAEGDGSEMQMSAIFEGYEKRLEAEGMDTAKNCIRTWIFVDDVDNNYSGVVVGRRNFFNKIGLTPQTHFIASTGINGRPSTDKALVQMDAIAVKGLKPEQVRYLNALDHLNPTYEYGVTFERGAAISFKDRTYILISGTASIDRNGKILHLGDPKAQTRRLVENIEALLKDGDATLKDVKVGICYLRRPEDFSTVKAAVEECCPDFPIAFVHAPVCRPGWLVEMEVVAIR